MTTERFNLSVAIYGLLDPEDATATIVEGESVPFAFFDSGGLAVRTTVAVDAVGLHELGSHLEIFSGVDITESEFSPGVAPGKRLDGIKNLKAGIVFLTQVDGQDVEQEIDFYDAEDDRER